MKLSDVVPWGRSLMEYKEMFSLSEHDLNKSILGCGDGPACFNAELSRMDGTVISIDPIYQYDAEQIRTRIDEVYPEIMEQMSKHRNDYNWEIFGSPEKLGKVRMDSMKIFLDDYEAGKDAGRYINAALPFLPFRDKEFGLALCSHYLFLYSDHVSQEQHIESMKELCRVAKEVRIYPILSLGRNKQSKHVEPVMAALSRSGIHTSLVPVEYEFQKGATKMLVAIAP